MIVAILCGGKGTRLGGHAGQLPKPLVEIGNRPVLWHIMKMYAHQGYADFVLCLGYKGDHIRDYFKAGENWRVLAPLSSNPSADRIEYFDSPDTRWRITFLDTGPETNTGGRVRQLAPYVDDTFFATYGDGVAALDLRALHDFHIGHGRVATLTAVQPFSQFGILRVDPDCCISRFDEKPRMTEWVNGGFFVFDRRVFDYLGSDDVLEHEPFQRLACQHQIMAYQHRGFWQCMDTYKDVLTLNSLWHADQAEWKNWDRETYA